MDLTIEKQREILNKVSEAYFKSTQIERLVLHHIAESSFIGEICTTQAIYEYIRKSGLKTSYGAIRSTILRIRHKLLKYKIAHSDESYHCLLPEQGGQRGYTLNITKNLDKSNQEDTWAEDPWQVTNWNLLKKQGLDGYWEGYAFRDGGSWPIQLSLYVETLGDELGGVGPIIVLLLSKNHGTKRIGFFEGHCFDLPMHLLGKLHSRHMSGASVSYRIDVKLWPFRHHRRDPVGISGRFTLLHLTEQEVVDTGRVELSRRRPSRDVFPNKE